MVDPAETESPASPARFVEFFADGWRTGSTQPERFFEHFNGRLTADAVMIQPFSRVARGPRGLRQLFEPLFGLIPDLRGEVVRWGATEDGRPDRACPVWHARRSPCQLDNRGPDGDDAQPKRRPDDQP